MYALIETIVKITLLVVLLLAGLAYWFVPRLAIARKFRMNETTFIISTVIGMICGAVGLVLTIVWPDGLLDLHVWELIMLPFVLMNIYWAIIMRVQKTVIIVDEKQAYNMTSAAGVTWAWSLPIMVLVFVLYQQSVLSGVLWFPSYLFASLLVFSAATLYLFKRN